MNSLTSLIALLHLCDELIKDLKTPPKATGTQRANQVQRVKDLLADAKADLEAFSARPIGQDLPITPDN